MSSRHLFISLIVIAIGSLAIWSKRLHEAQARPQTQWVERTPKRTLASEMNEVESTDRTYRTPGGLEVEPLGDASDR